MPRDRGDNMSKRKTIKQVVKEAKGVCSVCGGNATGKTKKVVKIDPSEYFQKDNLCLLCKRCADEYESDIARFDKFHLVTFPCIF